MSLAVANQYAKALLEVLAKPGVIVTPEEALAQLSQFVALQRSSPELRNVLLSPAVSHSTRERAVGRLASAAAIAPVVRNFLFVVFRHRRVGLLAEIVTMLRQLIDEREGVARALVTSARELDPAQRNALESRLAARLAKKIAGEYTIDPELVGGVSVRIGSSVLDGSIRGQLDALRRKLTVET
jgi:F-type H+-transporting ATPase subunit delta